MLLLLLIMLEVERSIHALRSNSAAFLAARRLALLVVTELHLQPCRCGQRHRCRLHRHRVADPTNYKLTYLSYLLTYLLTCLGIIRACIIHNYVRIRVR